MPPVPPSVPGGRGSSGPGEKKNRITAETSPEDGYNALNPTYRRRTHMNRMARCLMLLLIALGLFVPGLSLAQSQSEIARMINQGYDLLEQGKIDQAQKVYEAILRQDPGQPLALNNLAAIMVKQGKFNQALSYLKQALVRAKGLQVTFSRVCDVNGVCAACRMSEDQFGSDDLEGVIKINMMMVQMARSGPSRK
jgi:tetratricopeptide (TPR) repeat protein